MSDRSIRIQAESIMPDVVSLHLGAHKTASTHFQKTLRQNSSLLEQHGIKYVGVDQLRLHQETIEERFALPKVTKSKARVFFSRKALGKYKTNALGRTPQEELALLADGHQHLLLSNENFLRIYLRYDRLSGGRFYPFAHRNVGNFSASIAPQKIRVFISVRDPAEHLASYFVQKLKAGRNLQFDGFVHRVKLDQLVWSDLLARLSNVADVEHVTVWRYEDYQSAQPKIFSELLGAEIEKNLAPLPGRVNVGRSAKAIEETLRILGQREINQLKRKEVLAEMSEQYPISPEHPKFDPWSAEQHRVSAEAYKRDVDRISKMPKVTLITP